MGDCPHNVTVSLAARDLQAHNPLFQKPIDSGFPLSVDGCVNSYHLPPALNRVFAVVISLLSVISCLFVHDIAILCYI